MKGPGCPPAPGIRRHPESRVWGHPRPPRTELQRGGAEGQRPGQHRCRPGGPGCRRAREGFRGLPEGPGGAGVVPGDARGWVLLHLQPKKQRHPEHVLGDPESRDTAQPP